MATINLTDNYIKSLKATNGKRLEVRDRKVSGLVIRVSGRGRKTFVLRYRAENGRQPRFTIGTYPALGLADARDEAFKLLAQTKTANDPATERRRSRTAVKTQAVRSFDDLIQAYWIASEKGHWQPKKKKKRERTIRDEKGIYKRHIKAKLGKALIQEFTRKQVKDFLRDKKDTGIEAQTIQIQALIRQAFNYGIAEYDDLIKFNPAMGFGVVGSTVPRKRTLNDEELRTFWQAILDPPMMVTKKRGKVRPVGLTRSMGIALQLCILLLNRENEIAGMRVDELDFDAKTWLIPAERMKGGKAHLVPLPAKAISLIREALTLRTNQESAFVFPSPRWHVEDAAFSPSSIYHAMVTLVDAAKIKHCSPHDLRRTGSTALTSERIGVSPLVRSLVLSHASDHGGGAAVSSDHYDTNTYVAEKRDALTKWQNHVLKVVGGLAAVAKSAG